MRRWFRRIIKGVVVLTALFVTGAIALFGLIVAYFIFHGPNTR